MNCRPITEIDRALLYGRLLIKIIRISLTITHSLPKTVSSLGPILKEKRHDPRFGRPGRFRRAGRKIYWHMNLPGFPSTAFDKTCRQWLAYKLHHSPVQQLCAAHVAITNACRLKCEHCFEWESINQPEECTEEEIIKTVEQVISLGASQIVFCGGEPMARFPLLIRLLAAYRNESVQFWINTAAAGLTTERIITLKENGLTGITFSLDHHEKHAHDRFRGKDGCYDQVIAAAKTSRQLGLVTAFALCAASGFVTEKNLEIYMRLAADLGITFVQILEPKPIGKYSGHDVSLSKHQQKLLENLYDRIAIPNEPLISYPDCRNRRHGCEGGKLHLYVDTKGTAHPCPFCKTISAAVGALTPANLQDKLACPNY